MHESSSPAAELCPLCGQPNACAIAAQRSTGREQPPCWCNEAAFSAELISKIPEAARRRVCVCRACANAERPE
ncbi:MAG TPA: cysteine-rich CWC family protein [Ramlibacter sp.]|nr:cysteine-rich CWC family protein [Ramlibacter sp.]